MIVMLSELKDTVLRVAEQVLNARVAMQAKGVGSQVDEIEFQIQVVDDTKAGLNAVERVTEQHQPESVQTQTKPRTVDTQTVTRSPATTTQTSTQEGDDVQTQEFGRTSTTSNG